MTRVLHFTTRSGPNPSFVQIPQAISEKINGATAADVAVDRPR